MSHYTAAVFQTPTSSDVETLMAPYWEELRVEPYVYLTRSEALAEACEKIDLFHSREPGRWKHRASWYSEEILLDWFTNWYDYELDGDGNVLSDRNPRGQYDYTTEFATLSLGEWRRCGDIASEEELRQEWRAFSDENGDGYNEYWATEYDDEDFYVKACRMPKHFVVTPDGKWHEWVSPDRDRKFPSGDSLVQEYEYRDWVEHFDEHFVEPYDPDTTRVVLVDCHC